MEIQKEIKHITKGRAKQIALDKFFEDYDDCWYDIQASRLEGNDGYYVEIFSSESIVRYIVYDNRQLEEMEEVYYV